MIAPAKANGSLIYNKNHQVIGSALIGQRFTSLKYFQGRVSSINYDATGSGSPNYAPSNPELEKRVQTIWKMEKEQSGCPGLTSTGRFNNKFRFRIRPGYQPCFGLCSSPKG